MAQSDKEVQSLELLTGELSNQGNQFQLDAQNRTASMEAKAGTLQLYTNIVARLPAGSKVLTTKNVTTTVDSATGEIIVTKDMQRPPPNKVQLANDLFEQNSDNEPVFDVDKAMRDINNLSGEARGSFTLQTLSKIDTAFAERAGMLRKQAMSDAGVLEARAAVTRFTQASILKGFDPSQIIQVVNAEAALSRALAAATTTASLMITSDSELLKLQGSKQLINKMLDKQYAQGDRTQLIAEAVPKDMLFNYIELYGSTGNEFKDRLASAKVATTDPLFKIVANFNKETAPEYLTHTDGKVRATALKLLVGHDKALNQYDPLTGKGIPSEALSTPISKLVENITKLDIKQVIEMAYSDASERTTINTAIQLAKGKEKEQLIANIKANTLVDAVQKLYINSWNNAKGWSGTTVLPDQPLGKVINSVATTHNGKAPMNDVIRSFIQDDTIKDIDNKPMSFNAKLALLESTVQATASTEARSVLLRDPQAIKNSISNQIKNEAARAYVAIQIREVMLRKDEPFNSPIFGAP